MSGTQFGHAIRRSTFIVAIALVLAPQLTAQTDRIAAKASIEDLTAQWASLELPLLGVSTLTDLQRDAIELLEEKYRKLFNDEAGPIRAARITLYQRGPFERQNVERALERMAELRKRELELTRSLLNDDQRVRYDQNVKAIAAQEAAADAKRDREAAFVTP
jgi:Spy/CpxP family protein refolding chaperone